MQVTWGNATTTGTVVVKGVCPTDSVVKTVDIRPLPPLAVTPRAPSSCPGTATTLTVAGPAGLTYTWSGGGQAAAGTTLTVTPTTTTTYTVVGSNGTCTNSASVTVTVTPPPVANAGPDLSVCPNRASAPLGTTALPGLTYSWSPATGLSSPTAAQPTVTLPNPTGTPVAVTYTLTATSANGCVATSTVVVTVTPPPVANAGPDLSVCPNRVSAPLGTASVAGYTYGWSPATGLSSPTAAQPTVTLSNPTAAPIVLRYGLTVSAGSGCLSSVDSVRITVNPATVADAGPVRATCPNVASAPLGGAVVPGYTYSWSPATGLSNPAMLNPTVTGVNNTAAPVVRTYTLTATSANGCVATSTVDVTINPAAVADAGPARTICPNVASAPLGTPAVPGYTYAWSPATGLSSPTAAQPTVTLPNNTTAPITATYTVTATSAAGCTATSTVVLTVSPAAVATPGPAVSFCSGTVSAPLGGAVVPGYTYSWSPATGLSNPAMLNPMVTGINNTAAPVTGTYTLTATSATGCLATATVDVTINPAVADAGPARATCPNVGVRIGGTPVAGTTYAWSPATGLSSPTGLNPTVTLPNNTTAPTTVTYTLAATTATGCVSTGTVVVTVNPAPTANAGPDVAVCDRRPAPLGTPALAGYTYAWSPAIGLSSATAAQPVFTGVNTIAAPITAIYTLTATSASGCVATDAVTITLNPRPAAEAIAGPPSVCPTVTGLAYSVPAPPPRPTPG